MAFRKLLLTCAAITFGSAAIGILPAMAQPLMNGDETITVVPPRTIQQQPLTHGMKATNVSINRTVDITDLDLSKPADQIALRERVNGTAVAACRELDAKFPQTVYVPLDPQQNCVRDATRGALAMVSMPQDQDFPE